MKRILPFIATLFHIVCSADNATVALSHQSWDTIASDNSAKFDHHDNNSTRTVYVPNPIVFSTQHRHFSHHISTPHYNLNHMSTEQLIWYFSTNGYTEEDILSHPMLYMNQAYLVIAKQLPQYPEFVEKYYKKYRTYKGFFKFWETIHFRYRKGMKKQFARLHRECERQRLAKAAREQKDRKERAKKEHEARETYIRELARVENIFSDGPSCKRISISDHTTLGDESRMADHKARLEEIKISQQRPERKLRQLNIGQESLDFVAAYGIAEQQLAHVTLNSYEFQLHKEFVSHIYSTLALKRNHHITDPNFFIDALGNGIALGIQSNHLHNPEWATRWSDFCYEATEIICGIGDGIVLGSYNTVDMVMHPVHTLIRIADGIRMLGSLTARTVGTLAHWSHLVEHGECLRCITEMAAVGEQLTTMATNIKEATSQMSNRELAKQITAFGTEWALTGQMFAIGHTLCSNLGHTIKRTIKFLKDEGTAGEFALATTDGMLLKASENMNKSGGGGSNLIRDSRAVLETVHKQYMTVIEAELESLRLLCDNKVLDAANFGNKYLKPQYKHILGMELVFGRNDVLSKISGFHHDLLNILEKTGVIEFANKVVYENGFYKATLYHNGNIVKKTATFFPANWSRKQVIEAIYEAYTDFIKSGMKAVLEPDGKYRVDAVFNKQVTIRMHITKDAVIKTAYPILE